MYLYVHMVRRLAFPAPAPQWYGLRWGEGRGQERAGLRGLLGPSLHPNLDTKALQNPEPRPETSML